MKVELAKSAGFCFGVEKAVNTVYEEAKKGNDIVYTLGPIIHNEEVVKDMKKRGVEAVKIEDLASLPKGTVIIRSHGVSREIFNFVKRSGHRVVDATCPFVKKIHAIVSVQSGKGKTVVIIGNPEHPEVMGIRGWGDENTYAVENIEQFINLELKKDEEIIIVAQTTFNHKKFQEIIDKISILGYDVRCFNTICNATQERQAEAKKIASNVDAMIVIGDKKSSNTGKLVEICQEECKNTVFIQTLEDLDYGALLSVDSVGITAGASTPKHIIEEVQNIVRSKF
ncbi:MAG: 4-hydroxy-3-methylbut-2-enyl diphosphate reductase [Lachnoanaerobaculum sp.]|jgi:4-hydroxy-3-methylbut-2-enyl diphosphate reductase|uniref:4-hydroxy-3-methylbut-2-enyl diphosphate reductase n=1 Tax=unclassified Lachnoanaerobaculum TaxID=2625085 RepID=UPI00027A5B64|nr:MULTISPECIES: 4-hydroxy-3-methylbut-2-enyl diphosphate reductase [unclassified Lachnoanaerobaculum]EJP18569.1 4-hydroxy-3-methylbut-2-enyl diphosphate reductase [Lachnoanaerobaculum sp. ICM7]MBF1260529.1 4-hydroxy-3-methylbut-2-enyl diphosphate reductase [Lachnoanaerobaculum sp.]MBS5881167.1 4-hydroxy-3-methylbut-2-enyl diphosphate reductase [Lachnoanaerobaculum sp.]